MSVSNQHIIGLFRISNGSLKQLLVDVFGVGAMADMVGKGIGRVVLGIRKATFNKMLATEHYERPEENILIMHGAKPNETELQTARKLAKTDEYYLVFPNERQIREVRTLLNEPGAKKNDVFLIDKKTFKTIQADFKTCGNPSVETIMAHLSCGVEQAPNLILDITGKISKLKLIKGLRGGWSKRLRFLYLNYHGQWYLLDKAKVFDNSWLTKTLK